MKIKNNLVFLLCLFAISRLAFYSIFPTNWDIVGVLMQTLDLELLRTEYWKSLFYLHSQPPLFNAFIGFIAQFPSWTQPYIFQTVYTSIGLAALFCFYDLAKKITSESIAFIVSIFYCLCPSVLYMERIAFYPHLISALLIFMAWAFSRKLFSLAMVLTGILALTRSFYHLIWVIPVLALAITTKKQMSLAVITLLLCSIPYAVNYERYGVFSSSTWQGFNLYRTTKYTEEYNASPLSFPDKQDNVTGIKALDNLKKANGHPNMNNIALIEINKELQKKTISVIKEHPERYFLSVLNSFYLFFSADCYRLFDNIEEWLPSKNDSMKAMLIKTGRSVVIPIITFTMFMLSVIYFTSLLIKDFKLYGFLLFTMAYTFSVSIFLELGEQPNFRMPVDALLILGSLSCVFSMFKQK